LKLKKAFFCVDCFTKLRYRLLTDIPDIDLWSSFEKGDKTAFAELFRRHYSLLYQYGCKLSVHTTVVEDCIQELFAELWQNKPATTVQSVKAYLLTALKYKLFRVYRNRAAQTFEEVNEHIHFEISHDNFIIAREEDHQKTNRIVAALRQLPSRQKEIIYLKIYQNLGYEEISEIMGINYQVSRNLFSQSIKSLRKILQS
jgi:RNA polymerase sigma factor (sigma-70 family)